MSVTKSGFTYFTFIPFCDCKRKKTRSRMAAKTAGWHPAGEDMSIRMLFNSRLKGENDNDIRHIDTDKSYF